ncbi:MAG: NAD(+)/NADH kinase [Thermodesulfobacteriota bacterium]
MKKISIIAKISNPEAIKTAEAAALWLVGKGVEAYVENAIGDQVLSAKALAPEELTTEADAVLVLGGDGTILHAVRLAGGEGKPILGVNQGGLGFLTAITVDEMYPMLEKMLAGDFETEERMTFSVKVTREGNLISAHRVLNDAIIKGRGARLVLLETRINKEYVTTYRADGLIVATPTGSTAYSLSASGPILYPTIHSIIVSPICPFNLTNRPVVIPDWMTVDVTVRGAGEGGQIETFLTLDGAEDVALKSGDVVEIARAKESVYLVKSEGKSYFDILRERLMWELKVDSTRY